MDFSKIYQKRLDFNANPLFSFDNTSIISRSISTSDSSWNDDIISNDVISAPFFPTSHDSFFLEKVFILGLDFTIR